MSRVVTWLQIRELNLFRYVNGSQSVFMFLLLSRITHLGSATITIIATLAMSVFAPAPWNLAAMQAFLALAISHLPVAIMKKKFPRLRPYLVLPQTNICEKPLTDHSFPSGHTTAIFSVVVPFIAAQPFLAFYLLPIAVLVAMSRISMGLHYPSDCAAGAFLGTLTALLVCFFI